MTQHILQDRTEDEVLWFQRRSFVKGAAAWAAMGGFTTAHAQGRTNIIEMVGDAFVNGVRLRPEQIVQTGDLVETGPGSNLIFVMGNSSFQVRQNSRMLLERGGSISAVGLLRLLSGAVASVWSKGSNRQIITPTLTAGIRGTGVYTEIFANQNGRSYFCNCYGTVALGSGPDKAVSQASYHQAFWGEVEPKAGRYLTKAAAINHTDEELENLARLMNQRTAWQIMGKKGTKDGSGYLPDQTMRPHPAEMISK